MQFTKHIANFSLPLLAKELIEQAARKRTYIVRVVYAVLLFFTAFLFFNDLRSGAAVASAYAGGPNASRVVLNRVRDDLKMAEKPLLPYKAVVEVAAADVQTLIGVLDSSDKGAWRKANLTVIGREAILWDKISQT